MDIIEEEKQYGHVGKMRHIRISRKDTLVNDFKNSTIQGLVSLLLSLGAFLLMFFGIYRSYRMSGEGGYDVGLLMIGALLVATLENGLTICAVPFYILPAVKGAVLALALIAAYATKKEQ